MVLQHVQQYTSPDMSALTLESGTGSSDGDIGSALETAGQRRGRWVRVGGMVMIFGAATFFVLRASGSLGDATKGNARDAEQKTEDFLQTVSPQSSYSSESSVFPQTSATFAPSTATYPTLAPAASTTVTTVASAATFDSGTMQPYTQKRRRKSTSLIPNEIPNDNNECDSETEEELADLCYEKCSKLTNGKYPYRSNAFACCKKKSCATDIFSMKVASLLPCTKGSFDVDGDGASCPHPEGACLKDEDTYLGACYESCAKLTNGSAPDRVAPATCCKGTGAKCLEPWNLVTNGKFDVGGGKGDGRKSTPSGVHEPLKSITETTR